MNPLLNDIQGDLGVGRKIVRVSPRRIDGEKWNVDFCYENDKNGNREYACTHEEFMKWWKMTCAYVRSCAEAFADIEEN